MPENGERPTPTPWRVGELEPSIVLGPKHEAICSCFFFKERGAPQGEAAANARLIVRAVNAHEALLAALQRLVALGRCRYDPWTNDVRAALDAADAAIALATKGDADAR